MKWEINLEREEKKLHRATSSQETSESASIQKKLCFLTVAVNVLLVLSIKKRFLITKDAMMDKGKELSQDFCNPTVAKQTDAIGCRYIYKLFNVPQWTLWTIIPKWKEHNFSIRHTWPSGPWKVNAWSVAEILRRVGPLTKNFRNTSN